MASFIIVTLAFEQKEMEWCTYQECGIIEDSECPNRQTIYEDPLYAPKVSAWWGIYLENVAVNLLREYVYPAGWCDCTQ